jgi:hypothetical protein
MVVGIHIVDVGAVFSFSMISLVISIAVVCSVRSHTDSAMSVTSVAIASSSLSCVGPLSSFEVVADLVSLLVVLMSSFLEAVVLDDSCLLLLCLLVSGLV